MAGPSSNNWRQIVTSLYPDALTHTICVPPVHFNRVPYVRDTVPGTGESALVLHPPPGATPVTTAPVTSSGATPVTTAVMTSSSATPVTTAGLKSSGATPVTPAGPASQQSAPLAQYSLWTQESDPTAIPVRVQESDLRDDFAQNHVMLNLQELGNSRQEAMFILSQLQFGSYLNQPAYAAAAAQLPQPSQLNTKQIKYSDGEADFVLIHRQHGILIGELKSVGRTQAGGNNPQPPADADVAKRVEKAVKQLDRSETVVRHLVSDVAPRLTVRKTLFLPYVTAHQLKQVLNNDVPLQQAVCQSLGAADTAEAVQLCCCSDQLSQPASHWHVTPAVLSQLSTWWQHRMACTVDKLLTDQLYLDIVARFVGPATTVSVPCYNQIRVEVRTAGQAVAELGRRLALLVLTLQQLALLNRNPPLVCICGPPGTGKTVVLVLQGLRWLLHGRDVQVVCTVDTSRAVSSVVSEQLRMSLSAGPSPSQTPGTVFFHQYDFYNSEADVEQAVTDLLGRVKNGHLYVLLDEVDFDSREKDGPRYSQLVTRLTQAGVPHLHLWSASVYNTDIPPALQTQVFTVPLRSAPSVLREIQPVIHEFPVHDYSDSGVPAPGDGPSVIRLSHHGNAHTGRWPVDCTQCGQNIAAELRRLGVGSNVANSPNPLSYRDVFVLTRSFDLQDDVMDDAGHVTSPASGVVLGLRGAGLPVGVLGYQEMIHNRTRWESAVQDVAVAATDRITVSHYGYVTGLERRVVAMLQDRNQEDDDEGRTDEDNDLHDRLLAASRCTTQLIIVRTPPHTTTTTTTPTATAPTSATSTTTPTTTTTSATNTTTSAATTTTTTTTTSNTGNRT